MNSLVDTSTIPNLPGCYIFRNKRQEVIYIGKSKSLKNRVRQYFRNPASKEGKYVALLKDIHDIEIILTDTETNALILEYNLGPVPTNEQAALRLIFPPLFVAPSLRTAWVRGVGAASIGEKSSTQIHPFL